VVTQAVCIVCGERKIGALTLCASCRFRPETVLELTTALAFSERGQYRSRLQELPQFIRKQVAALDAGIGEFVFDTSIFPLVLKGLRGPSFRDLLTLKRLARDGWFFKQLNEHEIGPDGYVARVLRRGRDIPTDEFDALRFSGLRDIGDGDLYTLGVREKETLTRTRVTKDRWYAAYDLRTINARKTIDRPLLQKMYEETCLILIERYLSTGTIPVPLESDALNGTASQLKSAGEKGSSTSRRATVERTAESDAEVDRLTQAQKFKAAADALAGAYKRARVNPLYQAKVEQSLRRFRYLSEAESDADDREDYASDARDQSDEGGKTANSPHRGSRGASGNSSIGSSPQGLSNGRTSLGNTVINVRNKSGLVYRSSIIRVNKEFKIRQQPPTDEDDRYYFNMMAASIHGFQIRNYHVKAEAAVILKSGTPLSNMVAYFNPLLIIQYDTMQRVADMERFEFSIRRILQEADIPLLRQEQDESLHNICEELRLLPDYYHRRSITFRRIPILVIMDAPQWG
jgi:hypothetical protein